MPSTREQQSPIPRATAGTISRLETRLARTHEEVEAAQALRYAIFYQEMSAIANNETLASRMDKDEFDSICDHLLVVDNWLQFPANIIGTYRLLRQQIAEDNAGFYSSQQFDLSPMFSIHGKRSFLELGRSCVLAPYRGNRAIELLWQGVWAYVKQHRADVLIGCASIKGTDPSQLALPLSYLYHHARAPKRWRVKAIDGKGLTMNRVPLNKLDSTSAHTKLPPLIKAYLRLGAWIGEEAVIDRQFGTIDVLVILPIERINPRYISYYS